MVLLASPDASNALVSALVVAALLAEVAAARSAAGRAVARDLVRRAMGLGHRRCRARGRRCAQRARAHRRAPLRPGLARAAARRVARAHCGVVVGVRRRRLGAARARPAYHPGVTSPVRIMAVGGAAPAWRLAAADVAAAWGRGGGGRGEVAVCAPDEDVLTLSVEAATRAMAASGLQNDIVDGVWWGTSRPPFAEGPSHAVLASALGLSSHSGGSLCSGSPHAGMEALIGAADAIAAGSARVALGRRRRRGRPRDGHRVRGARRRGAAALVLVSEGGTASIAARVDAHPPLPRPLSRRRRVRDARLVRRTPLPRRGVPAHRRARSVSTSPRSISTSGHSPTPTAVSGPPSVGSSAGGAPASASVYTAVGRHRRGGSAPRRPERARRGRTVGDHRLRRRARHRRRHRRRRPGAGRGDGCRRAGPPGSPPRTQRCCGRAGSSSRRVRRFRWACRPRGAPFVRGADEMLGLLGARCVDCGTINTPPTIHPYCISCGSTKFDARAAGAPRRRAHVRREPHDAATVRAHRCRWRSSTSTTARGSCSRSSATAATSRSERGRAGAPTVRVRARRSRLRVQGARRRRQEVGRGLTGAAR